MRANFDDNSFVLPTTWLGDTLGGIGSAIALKRGTYRKYRDGSFAGTLVVQPDRGFNVYASIFVFRP